MPYRVRIRLLLALAVLTVPMTGTAGVTPERQSELLHLLRHDCGSCHGMTLKGGLGPSLLPDRLASQSREILRATIRHGRPGTPMPPWRGILKDEEIDWLLEVLYQGPPDPG